MIIGVCGAEVFDGFAKSFVRLRARAQRYGCQDPGPLNPQHGDPTSEPAWRSIWGGYENNGPLTCTPQIVGSPVYLGPPIRYFRIS